MKLITISILASFFLFNTAFADDTVIIIPNQNLLDETAHVRGLETSSSWSTVTVQIQSVSGELDKQYDIGSYTKFDKDMVFDLGDGANFLASSQSLKQQVKSLFDEIQNNAQSKHSKIYSQKLKSIIDTIGELESKSPLKGITIDYLESLVDYYTAKEKVGTLHFSSMEFSEIQEILDTIDFNVLNALGKAYKPYFLKDNMDDYPLTKFVVLMQTYNLSTVYTTLVSENSSSELCHENNLLDYCLMLASKALSVEPIHSPKISEKNFYCELTLMNDWLLMKPDAKSVASLSDATNQYTSLRLKQSRETPSYMQGLSATAKDCLHNYKGDVTKSLVKHTVAYEFYQKGIRAAQQDRAKKQAALARLVRDAKTQYSIVINDIVNESVVDINQTDYFYHQAIKKTETLLKTIPTYKNLSISELKKHLLNTDVRLKIDSNIIRISAELATAELDKLDDILLPKELEQAKASIRTSVVKLTEKYSNTNDNIEVLNKSVIEMFDKLSEGQFSINNKPVEQLASEKRTKLLNTVDNKVLLSEQGINKEFQRLKSESETFSNRIGVAVFEDEHIELLELKAQKYKLGLKEATLQARYKVPFKDGDKWLLTASCENGDVNYEFNITTLETLKPKISRGSFRVNKLPFVYNGFATNRKNKEVMPFQSKGTLTIVYRNYSKGRNAVLQSVKVEKGALPRGFKYFPLNLSSGRKFNSEESMMAFISSGVKRATKGCENEKIELVQSNDFELLNY